jgi:D-threo-aldose 1-dehydrogenase
MTELVPFPLGATGLRVTPICAGLAELGDLVESIGYAVPEDRARACVRAILTSGINFLDTAAAYGDGKSEARIGAVISEMGGLPPGFVVATKADRHAQTEDFSGDQARRSVERSCELLGLDVLPLVYLHDPEAAAQTFEELTGPGGALEALIDMQRAGVIQHIGFAGTGLELTDRFMATGAFSVVITHNQLTLLDQSAMPWVNRWARSAAVLNAAPYAGGILARGVSHGRYMYRRSIPPVILERVAAIEATCASFGVPVPAVALQFSLRIAAVSSTIVGMSSPDRVSETVRLATVPIPDELWRALDPDPGRPLNPTSAEAVP